MAGRPSNGSLIEVNAPTCALAFSETFHVLHSLNQPFFGGFALGPVCTAKCVARPPEFLPSIIYRPLALLEPLQIPFKSRDRIHTCSIGPAVLKSETYGYRQGNGRYRCRFERCRRGAI